MEKIVVVFESHYGFTKQYAKWISEELACPLYERKKFPLQDLNHYDTVIYGGGLYAGGVSGIQFLTKNWKLLAGKRLILFTCGLADPSDEENRRHIREGLSKALSKEILEKLQLFHLRGGIDYDRLSFVHRTMMSMLRKMLLKKNAQELNEESRQLLATYGQRVNFTSRESLAPLIQEVRSVPKEHP